MANAVPTRYAPPSPGDRAERSLLAGLSFVGRKQAEFCLDAKNSIERVRSELNRVYSAANEMPALNARILGRPQPAPRAQAQQLHQPSFDVQAVREAEARAEQHDFICERMQSGKYAHDATRGTSYCPKTGIQRFGVAQ